MFFEFARIADAVLSEGGWVLIENVPGLLSSKGGRDFGIILATLAELGFHDLAWRVLDSRYFGVPQRRRRVFILARRSRGRRASEVLLEPESSDGDFETSGEAGQKVARGIEDGIAGTLGGRNRGDELDRHGAYIIARTLTAKQRWDGEIETFIHEPSAEADSNRVREAARLSRRVDRCAFDPRPDGPRYAACGDAVTVSVAEWIGRRLMEAVS